ncbi:acyl-CoA dehydrogenase [Celeribacter marinus]|uniref:acyl-CoA dehydrogenase n=1 Tax=Celeribacter marinus TaxID=1397108 RepID=UPI003F6C1D6D
MADRLLCETDMEFQLFDWLGLEDRLSSCDLDGETARAYLGLSQKLASDQFLPHYKASDVREPRLDNGSVYVLPEIRRALDEYRDLGLFGASFPEDLGGMGMPYLLSSASYAWFAAANCSSIGYTMLTGANARLIAEFASPSQVDTFAKPQIEGRWFGTMCLSEPQAGSGLADVRTRAVADGVDAHGNRFRVSGSKMWISGGDQDISENIVHLVLAKVPNASGDLPIGTEGISLFIVPKVLPNGDINDVAVAGLNHKMGNRGTSNCLLNFGEVDGAIGWMVGEPGQGLRQMFMMMNEARIAVGFGAAALACRGYLLAVDYARDRLQGRAAGERDGPPVAIIEHTDVRRMLLAMRAYAEGSMGLCLYSAALVDSPDDPDDAALLELLTPVAKTFPSEYGPKANDLAIQIHGGYGYTRDFDVEQLYRDNRLNPIHEGTTGIQALDLLGRKILRDGRGLEVLYARMSQTCAKADQIGELSGDADALRAAIAQVQATIDALRNHAKDQQMNNAAQFQTAFGLVVVAWIWLDQAVAVHALPHGGPMNDRLRAGKTKTCRFFFASDLPIAAPLLAQVASGCDVARAAEPDNF